VSPPYRQSDELKFLVYWRIKEILTNFFLQIYFFVSPPYRQSDKLKFLVYWRIKEIITPHTKREAAWKSTPHFGKAARAFSCCFLLEFAATCWKYAFLAVLLFKH
jgi:hypothetical protein